MTCNVNLFAAKLGDHQGALETFEKALELAKILEDEAAEKAISKTINDINNRIALGENQQMYLLYMCCGLNFFG